MRGEVDTLTHIYDHSRSLLGTDGKTEGVKLFCKSKRHVFVKWCGYASEKTLIYLHYLPFVLFTSIRDEAYFRKVSSALK